MIAHLLAVLAALAVGSLVTSAVASMGAHGLVARIWGALAGFYVLAVYARRRRPREMPMVIPDVEPDEPPSGCDCQTRAAPADHDAQGTSWTP